MYHIMYGGIICIINTNILVLLDCEHMELANYLVT